MHIYFFYIPISFLLHARKQSASWSFIIIIHNNLKASETDIIKAWVWKYEMSTNAIILKPFYPVKWQRIKSHHYYFCTKLRSSVLNSSQMHYWHHLKKHFKAKKNSRHHHSFWKLSNLDLCLVSAWKVSSQWTQRPSFLPVGYHQPPPWSTSTSKWPSTSLAAQRSATYTVSRCVKIKTESYLTCGRQCGTECHILQELELILQNHNKSKFLIWWPMKRDALHNAFASLYNKCFGFITLSWVSTQTILGCMLLLIMRKR